MKTKPYKRTLRALYILLAIFLFLAGVATFFLIASSTADLHARVLPPYAREDISPILEKSPAAWTEGDVEILRAQTGILSEEALRREAEQGGRERLLAFQDALFFEGKLVHETIVEGVTFHDMLYAENAQGEALTPYHAPIVTLEAGDVIVTSTTHTLGFRHGHAALMLRGGMMIQSVALGIPSQVLPQSNESAGVPFFQYSANFIVLRPKREAGESDADYAARRAEIADFAAAHLEDIPYSLTVGIFSKKDQGDDPKATHCSHLVWQAFKHFGYDIDADGGPVVTPRDISESDCFETVQVYGFDPAKGW